ncbi:transcription factor Zn- C2H2 / Cys6 [Apiospora sp. TS-2023a]
MPQDPAGPFHLQQTDHHKSTDNGPSLDPVQIIGMMTVRGEQKDQCQPADYVDRMREILCAHGPEEAMRQLLSDNQSPSLSLLRQTDGQFETFAEEHQKTYVEVFHEVWPFLHATTLNMIKDNIQLAASVITTGILLKKDASETSRSKAISCHDIMMGQFFRCLSETPRDPTDQAWPMEWYQAVLLNIIIGAIRNELPRSRLLCSLFITHLRLVGVFDSTTAEAQRKKYHPGSFYPFVYSIIEQRSRLIAYLFKADALLSLLDEQPPMLHAEELDTRLPQTFALWNAYGLDVFFKRYGDEPGHRSSHKLSDIVKGPFVFTTASIVAEDVEFGLWAMAREIWQHRQRQRMARGGTSDMIAANGIDNTQSALLHKLRGGRYQIIGLQRLCSTGDAATVEEQANALRLFRAYRGNDDAKPSAEWQQLARHRASNRVREAMNLHDALESCLHSCSTDPNQISAGNSRVIGMRHTLLQSLDMGGH